MFAMKHPVLTVKDSDIRYEEVSEVGSDDRDGNGVGSERGSGSGQGSDWKSELYRHVQYLQILLLPQSVSRRCLGG